MSHAQAIFYGTADMSQGDGRDVRGNLLDLHPTDGHIRHPATCNLLDFYRSAKTDLGYFEYFFTPWAPGPAGARNTKKP